MTNPEKIAEQLVKDFGFRKPPIDVEHICHSLGIKLRYAPTYGEIMGIASSNLAPDGSQITAFTINSRLSLARKRFTTAHEIGHFMLGHIGLRRNPAFERAANRFASELLMPDNILAPEWHRFDLEDLARRYVVSFQAMSIRIESYHMILQL